MRQRQPRKGEHLKARISFRGKFDRTERKAIASWLRRAAHLFANDADYAEIRNFRLFY